MLDFLPIVLVLALVAACIKPLGSYMARVYRGHEVWLHPVFGRLELGLYRLCGIEWQNEMTWRAYAMALLAFNFFGFLLLFILFTAQGALPLNPQEFPGLSADLAFNAAMSFVTNTNWQSYSGETSLSYLSQMVGCTVQNFLSAATGMAVAVALFRALSRKQMTLIGNFWADMVRTVLYVLLPLAFAFSLILASQGVVQTFRPYVAYQPLEGSGLPSPDHRSLTPDPYLIAVGPAASQVAIKMLGSNGGGFFNANGAHPFENPTPFSNLLQMMSILLIPAALVYTFGAMIGDRRQALVLLAAMFLVFVPLMLVAVAAEQAGNPRLAAENIVQPLGNMEGKEERFGVVSSAFWATATTATSNGSVNAMHDSFTPLGSLVPLTLMVFGEVIFGGAGSGAYGMIVFVVLTVFIAGLMVGRTPEYLGKKLGAFEIKMASLCILIPAACTLVGTALAAVTEAGRAGVFNPGAQALSEVLYAMASASNNNGSALAGLAAGTPFYNILLGILMCVGRYGLIIPVLAMAGRLAAKNKTPVSPGTLPTHTPLFVAMLIASIILIGVLTYVPVLALGPAVEHLRLFGAVAP